MLIHPIFLKSKIDKLDTDELEKLQNSLNSLKSKLHKLGVDKLKTVLVDLKKKRSDAVERDVVKKTVYDEFF